MKKSRLIVGTIAALVVCFSICLLMAFVLQQRGDQYRVTCQSNLRQIGQAIQMYVADNDGLLPTETQWRDKTIPSLPNYSCSGAEAIPHLDPPLPSIGRAIPGYAYNANLGGKPVMIGGRLTGTSLAYTTLTHPQTTLAVFDYTSGIASTSQLDLYKGSGNSWPKELAQGWKRHNGGGNYLFCDGHVAWYKESQILSNLPDICQGNNIFPNFCAD